MNHDCSLCGSKEINGKSLSRHLRKDHDLSYEEYVIETRFAGRRPLCKVCSNETRFVHKSFSFKEYCVEHARLACSLAGKKGGKYPSPFKGKTKETSRYLLALSESMKGAGNPFYGKSHSSLSKDSISISKRLGSESIESRLEKRKNEFELISDIADYVSRQKQYLKFRCVNCRAEQEKTLQAFERGSKCDFCFPIGRSQWENDVYEFVRTLDPFCISNDRSVIGPKELDVYVPSKKVAIECHGLYWHSECAPGGIIPNSHLKKKEECQQKGISLIQFFQDEWIDKRSICESMIRHRLNLSSNVIYARDCQVVEISWPQAREFFDSTHISGAVPSSFYLALFDRKRMRLVSCIAFRKPRQRKYDGYLEISRFSSELGSSVVGGLSKLVTYARLKLQGQGWKGIITYADRRFGEGIGYQASGFVRIGQTGIDYFYTDLKLRYDRFKFRAKDGVSESKRALDAKVWRIYGCGSIIYRMEFDT